jgi:hypothetical protein
VNLFAKWNHILHDELGQDTTGLIPALVDSLLQHYTRLWWSCERDFPSFNQNLNAEEHSANEKMLDNLSDGLIYELKHIQPAKENRQLQINRIKMHGKQFASRVFDLEQRHLDFIEESKLLEAAQEFARMARAFDPKLRAEEIYQAGRNVMTMNLIQLLFDLPVEVTPSVFAYSMLYPYTDNYLDSQDVSQTTKLAFNHRFQRRLAGDAVHSTNLHEAMINSLIAMIEDQWDRSRYPKVYDSLLAIHAAQVKSLGLVAPGASPYELDVLGISFEKGGTSVLADGYLVAGQLTTEQAALLFGYGCFTQLMDDLEDMETDLCEGQMTIFSQTAHHWSIDYISNRLFHFGHAIFSDLRAFPSPTGIPLKEIMDRAINPLLIDSISRLGPLYSKGYLTRLEGHFPFRFAAVRKQCDKLSRHKITLERVFETFVLPPEEGGRSPVQG